MSLPAADAPAGARCAVHPAVGATATCERCGSYTCIECMVPTEEALLCATCSRRFARGRYGSWLAIAAGIAGFLGLGCGLAGPLAIVLASIDLAAIAARRSPKGGLRLCLLGLGLGLAGTALWAYILFDLSRGETYPI